ncbi:hypothetical protein BC826DRAFT_1015357 [Russula brevipes]|nr:hypothetical protein BC826DRAFT_1015357 [Russula brevipes]
MPLASSGLLSSTTRQALRVIHKPPNVSSARTLNTPSFAPRPPLQQPSPFATRVLHRTRTILNAFVGHLTTPGTLRPPGAAPRTLQSAASRMPRIESNWSLPVRHTLIAQVGLGTARNFTTGRPIFQSIADKMHNIPVASRAFLEADLDMRSRDDHALALKLKAARRRPKRRSRPAACASSKVHFHPAAASSPTSVTTVMSASATEAKAPAEFDKYFAPPQFPDVSTTLLVPLAPTPTARLPLARTFAYDRHPLVPFLELSALRVDTERHASRVRILFEQLDAAQVWEKGATCEALGGARGASVLRIRFAGWSAYAVRGILGEAATGWCVLEEERAEEDGEQQDEAAMSMSDVGSQVAPNDEGLAELNLRSPIDPAYSFVLPTLDFSASSPIGHATTPAADDTPLSASDLASNGAPSDFFDTFSDPGYVSDGSSSGGWVEPPDALYASRTPSWAGLSFSSAFSQRLEEGPQEEMF